MRFSAEEAENSAEFMMYGDTDFLTVSQFAAITHFSDRTVRDRITAGKIEAFKFGGHQWRIPRSAIEPSTTTKPKTDADDQSPSLPVTVGQEVSISVLAQTGRREFGVGPHLMWASLEIGNPNPTQALTDVQVRFIACDHIEQKQRRVPVENSEGRRERAEDVPNTFIDMGTFLSDWIPIHLLWAQTQADTTAIPPAASRTIIVAFSDNSNGPPAVFNDRAHTHALSESRITVEVSSPGMTAWYGRFFINCHPNYIYRDGLRVDSHFEFEPWETWASTRKVLSLDEALPDDLHSELPKEVR